APAPPASSSMSRSSWCSERAPRSSRGTRSTWRRWKRKPRARASGGGSPGAARNEEGPAAAVPAKALALSFPRRREGGFTFEVQQFGKDLGRGLPAEALPGRVIVESGELLQLPRRDGAQVGLA